MNSHNISGRLRHSVRLPKRTLLPDIEDARHMFQAVQNGVDSFVTADERTILAYADVLRELLGIEAVSPSEIMQRLSV